MLIEAIKYLYHSISCPKYISKIGLLEQLISLESRYQRCKLSWSTHLEISCNAIIDAIARVDNKDKAVILGAGLLNDVPLAQLSQSFNEVILVDIFFLEQVIKQSKTYSNVRCQSIDITNNLEACYKLVSSFLETNKRTLKLQNPNLEDIVRLEPHIQSLTQGLEELATRSSNEFMLDDGVSLVVSLNLASQLPISIRSYLEKRLLSKLKRFRLETEIKDDLKALEQSIDNYLKSLIVNHISYLEKLASHHKEVLMLTDTIKQVYNTKGELQDSESSLEGLDINQLISREPLEEWTWDLAPIGEMHRDYSLKLLVKSYSIN